jgi:hypothetical protein
MFTKNVIKNKSELKKDKVTNKAIITVTYILQCIFLIMVAIKDEAYLQIIYITIPILSMLLTMGLIFIDMYYSDKFI